MAPPAVGPKPGRICRGANNKTSQTQSACCGNSGGSRKEAPCNLAPCSPSALHVITQCSPAPAHVDSARGDARLVAQLGKAQRVERGLHRILGRVRGAGGWGAGEWAPRCPQTTTRQLQYSALQAQTLQSQMHTSPGSNSVPALRASAPRSCLPPGQGPPCRVPRQNTAERCGLTNLCDVLTNCCGLQQAARYGQSQWMAGQPGPHAAAEPGSSNSSSAHCCAEAAQPPTDTQAAAAQTQPQQCHALPGKHEQREVFKKQGRGGGTEGAGKESGSSGN